MTDELKNDLLNEKIQCISNDDGKFVFFRSGVMITEPEQTLVIKSIFSSEIPVGSILIIKANENGALKTLVFVCCNASQPNTPEFISKNNLFWFEISNSLHYISSK